MSSHPLDRDSIKQVCAVLDMAGDSMFLINEREGQIEFCHPAINIDGFGSKSRQFKGWNRSILESEHDLENRVTGQVALGL